MPVRTLVADLERDDPRLALAVDDVADQLADERVVDIGYVGFEELTSTVGRHLWADRADTVRVEVVDDRVVDARYAEVRAPSSDVADVIVGRLASIVPHVTLDDVLARLDVAPGDARSVNLLGLVGPATADRRITEPLVAAMASGAPAIRAAAANAAGLLAWPELAAPLSELIGLEPPGDIRTLAEQALLLCTPLR